MLMLAITTVCTEGILHNHYSCGRNFFFPATGQADNTCMHTKPLSSSLAIIIRETHAALPELILSKGSEAYGEPMALHAAGFFDVMASLDGRL